MNNRMNIALIYSPNWISYIKVQLYAMFKTNPPPVKVYLISDAAGRFDTSNIISYFGEGCTTEFIDAEDMYNKKIPSKINVNSRFTKFTLYRLLLPELIQDNRILYIDSDTVTNGDLSDLYNVDLQGSYIAGASDIHANDYKLRENCGLSYADAYINAGVILMDLEAIRKNKIYDKLIYEVNNRKYQAFDQCIINKTCKGKIKLIDNKYNCSISAGLNVPREEIKIAHYTGTKPWIDGNVPNARIWFDWVREYRKVFGGND